MSTTPYMNLNLPTPTVTEGPEYAELNNTAFEVIDSHDHSPGKGQPITPVSMNINEDLNFYGNSIINSKTLKFSPQDSVLNGVTDFNQIYNVNGDLYYNDSNGSPIRLTANGALDTGSSGNIGGEYSGNASLDYNNITKTFVFNQNISNTPANINAGTIVVREPSTGSSAISIKSPTSLPGAYNLILPTGLPGSNLPMFLNSLGQISTGTISTNIIDSSAITQDKLATNSVATSKIIDSNVTSSKINTHAVTTRELAPLTTQSADVDFYINGPTSGVWTTFSITYFSVYGSGKRWLLNLRGNSDQSGSGPKGSIIHSGDPMRFRILVNGSQAFGCTLAGDEIHSITSITDTLPTALISIQLQYFRDYVSAGTQFWCSEMKLNVVEI